MCKHHSESPIHKKGLRSEAENYRPISLTSAVCKALETMVKKQMTTYLESEGIVTNHQHGFVRTFMPHYSPGPPRGGGEAGASAPGVLRGPGGPPKKFKLV